MKRAICFILLFTFSKSYSQGFLPFHKERPAYYQFDSYDVFYQQASIAIDSFKLNGTDTTFFHSSIIDWDNSIYGCYLKAHDTSFLSITSIRQSTGDDFFFNRDNDSIYFNNSASLNQNWELFHFANGDVIKATVQSIDEVSVLGVNDSVKTITLQAQNSGVNNITNIFNGKIFRVGKATGFVSGYSLFHFPEDTIGFLVVGIENPPQGLNTSELSPEKIFDFEVGDRFDFIQGSTTNPGYITHSYEIRKILSKEIDGDTIKYEMNHKQFFETWNFGNYTSNMNDWTYTIEYITTDFAYLNLKPFQLSYEPNGSPLLILKHSDYDYLGTIKSISTGVVLQADDCAVGLTADCYGEARYAKGLGQAYYFCGEPYYDNYFDTLVYFNKDGVEWGDSINWDVVTGVNLPTEKNSVQVFPNPTNDFVLLEGNFTSPQSNIHFLNLLGEEMKVITLAPSSQNMRIDISDLPNGVYLLKIQSGEKVFTQKIIKD